MQGPLFRRILLFAAPLALLGCQGTHSRIAANSAAYSALDPAAQANVRAGIVQPGYTTDMVFLALGKPAQTTTDAAGQTVWVYRYQPATAHNETVLGGSFVRRTVYDPVKRTNDVVVEPIDEKAFPHLIPRTLRLTFQNGQLVSVAERKGT